MKISRTHFPISFQNGDLTQLCNTASLTSNISYNILANKQLIFSRPYLKWKVGT